MTIRKTPFVLCTACGDTDPDCEHCSQRFEPGVPNTFDKIDRYGPAKQLEMTDTDSFHEESQK